MPVLYSSGHCAGLKGYFIPHYKWQASMGGGEEEEWMDDKINENNIIIDNNNNNNNGKKQIILLYKGRCQYWVPRRR